MSRKTPKYIQVEDKIRRAINEKILVDKLPGERLLAEKYGVSYMTVRKAIDNLVNEGILFKLPTKGTFVYDLQKKNSSKSNKHKTIGYFLDSSIISGISGPYYSLIFHAIEKYAANRDYSVVYFTNSSEASFSNTLEKLDGVIATCFPRIEEVIQSIKQQVPVVVIDNSASDKSIPSVIIDNFNAEMQSLDYICSLGHKRIGFMTGLDDSDIGKSRFDGYQNGLKKHGIKFDINLVYRGNYSFEAGIGGANYFTSMIEPPTAIICANDSMAIGAMKKLKDDGYRVPEDISLIGFDDIEVSSHISPTLTTIAAPVEQIASSACELLDRVINHQELTSQHTVLPAKLVKRGSCTQAPCPVKTSPKKT